MCACVWRQQGTQRNAGNQHTLLIGYYVTLLLITKSRLKNAEKVIYYCADFFYLRYFLTYYVIYFIIDLDENLSNNFPDMLKIIDFSTI